MVSYVQENLHVYLYFWDFWRYKVLSLHLVCCSDYPSIWKFLLRKGRISDNHPEKLLSVEGVADRRFWTEFRVQWLVWVILLPVFVSVNDRFRFWDHCKKVLVLLFCFLLIYCFEGNSLWRGSIGSVYLQDSKVAEDILCSCLTDFFNFRPIIVVTFPIHDTVAKLLPFIIAEVSRCKTKGLIFICT